MLPTTPLHASVRRDEPLRTQLVTGEVRVPLTLYSVDENRGALDLVLSRAEGQMLLTQLAEALGLVHPIVPVQRALGAVR